MKKKVFVLMISLIVILGVVGTSYSYLKAEKVSTNNSGLTLSNFGVILLNDMTSVSVSNAYPMSDSDGLFNTPTTFQVKNTGTMMASYKISLVDKEGITSTMKNTDVRYQLKRTSDLTNETTTLDIKNLDDEGLIDTGNIEVGETFTYELVMWIDYDANPNGLSFSKVVLVEGMQIASLDQSGANFPELTDNMIPIYYDKVSDTEGVWRVADRKNLNETYKWFDYSDFMWANAVTVSETSTLTTLTLSDDTTIPCTGTNEVCTREDYLNAPAGTVIPMEDITTMWVWIPRYKYVIFTGLNQPSEEQLINIEFEHGIASTGTVTCVDNILTGSVSNTSETCTDSIGTIVKGKSTYTHPVFTFGDEELTGFWMAKFEMSTDDTTCIDSKNETNCNKTNLNILIKPNVDSLTYQTVSTRFANIKRMEIANNIHGFPQSENATTWLDENSYLTGEIKNDNNNIDTHMLKNMEWGAVAYLSQSQYGKWANPLYTGDYRRVYKNNYYTSTNYVFKTGYSGGIYNGNSSTSASSTFQYNDLTIASVGSGYRGAGASTTGNVYGVYDMNGGTYESVMGNMVNTSGNFYPSSAGTWSTSTTGNIPNARYYDKYSYNLGSANQTRGKLGDATREATTTFGSYTGGWGGVYRFMPDSNYPWFIRGVIASNTVNWGIFSSGNYNGTVNLPYGGRPALVVSREFPWLSE